MTKLCSMAYLAATLTEIRRSLYFRAAKRSVIKHF